MEPMVKKTPLHRTIELGYIDITLLIIDPGGDANAITSEHKAPLQIAFEIEKENFDKPA